MRNMLVGAGLVLATCTNVMAQPWTEDGIIPDERTAIEVALVLFKSYFGDQVTAEGQPYKARLWGDEWIVYTTPASPDIRGGGTPEIALSKKDGRVLRIGLSK